MITSSTVLRNLSGNLETAALKPGTGDIEDLFYLDGRPLILPASSYALTTAQERGLLGLKTGTYGFLTLPLIEWLRDRIGDRSAIEIGSGNGALALALGIPATDSKMQDDPKIAALYGAMGQTTVSYGDNVKRFNAQE